MDEPDHREDEDALRDRVRRLRWRLRGAWMLPTFALCTVAGAILLHELPIAGTDTDLVGAFLLCGFANVVVVAAAAPLAGRLLRRRRPSLPSAVAVDRAGTTLLVSALVAFALIGALHHASVADQHRGDARALAAARAFVRAHGAPQYAANVAHPTVWKPADFLYRTCFAGADPAKDLCLYVDLSHDRVRVHVDPDQQPNAVIAGAQNPGRSSR